MVACADQAAAAAELCDPLSSSGRALRPSKAERVMQAQMITGPDGTGAGAGTEISCLQVRDHHKVRCIPPSGGGKEFICGLLGERLLRCVRRNWVQKLGTMARQAA